MTLPILENRRTLKRLRAFLSIACERASQAPAPLRPCLSSLCGCPSQCRECSYQVSGHLGVSPSSLGTCAGVFLKSRRLRGRPSQASAGGLLLHIQAYHPQPCATSPISEASSARRSSISTRASWRTVQKSRSVLNRPGNPTYSNGMMRYLAIKWRGRPFPFHDAVPHDQLEGTPVRMPRCSAS